MPVRRAADPTSTQHVWDAIRAANAQRQMADLQRIVKYLQRVDKCSQAQAELYMQQTLTDGLIVELHKVTAKGSAKGTEVESYKIPMQEMPAPEDDGKDWYCIDCHLAGDVTPCRTCPRVYHAECAHKKKTLSNKPSLDLNVTDKKRPLGTSSPFNQDQNIVQENEQLEAQKKTLSNKSSIDVISADKKRPFATSSPLSRDPITILEAENLEPQTDPLKDAVIENPDDSLSRLVDDVEKKLEKMEESYIMNSSSYSDSSTSNPIISPSLVENDKENGISSSNKDCDAVLDLNEDDKDVYDLTLCSVCNMYKTQPELNIEKKELNFLLTFVHNRIKSWVPLSITDTVPPEDKPEWYTEFEVNWRAKQLFYQPMNMVIIEAKLQTEEYTHICQFKADVLTVRHNVAVYHGTESQEFDCADFLWKDCDRELSELSNCVDCFRHSNQKINNKWFCLPCRVSHNLVWAKQKGYPPWPAKVIKETDENYDVRFFGGKYERSILPKSSIKPITHDVSSQQPKKNSALMKSIEELQLHQKFLADPSEVQKYVAASSRKRKNTIKSIKLVPSNKMMKTGDGPKKRSKSVEFSKDVYEFRESPLNFDATTSGVQTSTVKRKKSTSPAIKGKLTSTRATEYPTRRSVQNQINKSKAANNLKNGATKTNAIINALTEFHQGEEYAIRDEDYEFGRGYDGSYQEVSSSTEQIQSGDESYVKDNSDGLMPKTERQYSEAVEKTRRKLETCRDKKQLIKIALECMQAEIDTINNAHDDYLKKVFEAHNAQISETKKKQWCFHCEQDAIYHCCWNTAYCSPTCQQQHWQAEHKKPWF